MGCAIGEVLEPGGSGRRVHAEHMPIDAVLAGDVIEAGQRQRIDGQPQRHLGGESEGMSHGGADDPGMAHGDDFGFSGDMQRVGSDKLPTDEFIDFSTVAIGLYGAAAHLPLEQVLGLENWYASHFSNFGPVSPDKTYTSLPYRNVYNTINGYKLYQSGKIGPTPLE